MSASVRAAWRVAAAVAFAATAALAVTLTRGAPLPTSLVSAGNTSSATRNTIGGSNHAPSGPPRCAPSRLDVSIGSIAAPAARIVASHDHVYVIGIPLEFTNISGTTCTLSGFPGVSAYLAGGAQIGNSAVLDTSISARRIVLAPGASAHAAVVDSASPGHCRLVAATGLRVVPPGAQSVARYVRHAVTACSAVGRTAPVFLRVRAVQPGTGVPAVTRTRRAGSRHAFRPQQRRPRRQAPFSH